MGLKSYFPSQAVNDFEKESIDYGLKVAKAIESEWFNNDRNKNKHLTTLNNFHKLRLYARGEQSVQKYKDELSINGDLSYLNLDWKPVPIIPKFVDIVVNGMSQRTYDIKAFSQDPHGLKERTEYMENIVNDMHNDAFNQRAETIFGIDLRRSNEPQLPQTNEELRLHMQLTYKQAVEIAEEQAINLTLENNRYDLIQKQYYYDLAVLGIGAVKTSFDTSSGIQVNYVDPANLVYSHTESPYFEDIYYVGEVKTIPINELVKQFPNLLESEIKEILDNKNGHRASYNSKWNREDEDENTVQVLYFNYKTYMSEVFKLKETATGGLKAIMKDDTFSPPPEMLEFMDVESRKIECLYEGVKILGTDLMLKWELAPNMLRPKNDHTKVKMNYSIVAPRMYNGRIESIVSRITTFADMIQLTHLKLQQVLSRMVPDGVYLDADGLAEVDLGNGTAYNPQEALNMFFQTGSVIGRSYTSEGDMNPGKVPIQEITSGAGGNKLQALIGNYNYYLQMIRDVTGLNEARDGSMPDKDALVGIQKIAAANSNVATRHILDSGLFLTAEVAEQIMLRVSDVVEFSPTADAFVQSIGAHNVGTLEEMYGLHTRDFGIFIELQPDEEEKQILETNIQTALTQQSIELEDAIEIREVRNLKLANQLLKIRRTKKRQRDQEEQERNIQAQADSNAKAAQSAAAAEMQKEQGLTQSRIQLEQAKAEFSKQKMLAEVEAKKSLMALEFQYNMQLAQMNNQTVADKDRMKEDRKDARTKIQATQQSEMIEQRKTGKPPKNFESSGNDIVSGDFGLDQF